MDHAALVELVETKHRMRISPNDPVFLLATICEALNAETKRELEAAQREIEAAVARVEAAAARVDAPAPPPSHADYLRVFRQGISAHLGRLVMAMQWGNVIFGVLLILGAAAAGWGAHWWITPHLDCHDDRGGRYCYTWAIAPTR